MDHMTPIDVNCTRVALYRANKCFDRGDNRLGKRLTLSALETISGCEDWGPAE